MQSLDGNIMSLNVKSPQYYCKTLWHSNCCCRNNESKHVIFLHFYSYSLFLTYISLVPIHWILLQNTPTLLFEIQTVQQIFFYCHSLLLMLWNKNITFEFQNGTYSISLMCLLQAMCYFDRINKPWTYIGDSKHWFLIFCIVRFP